MMHTKEIAYNKARIFLFILAAIGFVVVSIWVLFYIPTEEIRKNAVLVKGACVLSIVIFGYAMIALSIRMFANKPGLIIDQKGYIDNSNSYTVGRVYWKDVVEITTEVVKSNKLVIIKVRNPEEYLSRLSRAKAFFAKQNLRTYGTPITASHLSLKLSHKGLHKLLVDSWKMYR